MAFIISNLISESIFGFGKWSNKKSANTAWDRQYLQYSVYIQYSVNYDGVYGTALATPGLLKVRYVSKSYYFHLI